MSVSQEQIRTIKPGMTEAFSCSGREMFAAATAISTVKRMGMPEGVVDYEHKKLFDKGIIIIRAMGEGDEKILNQSYGRPKKG